MDITEQPTQQEDLSTQVSNEGGETAPSTEQPDILDLDSTEKFRFEGREWTPAELKKAYMMQSDYTRKTQELGENRKYYDNLVYDLPKVLQNPALVAEFKRVYPNQFHSLIGHLESKQQADKQGVDPEFYREFQEIKTQLRDQRVSAIEAELDHKFSTLSQKYPYADEEVVIARAQTLLDSGQKLSDEVWDKLWKSNHEKISQAISKNIQSQKSANAQGKDMGSGGGIAGQAPVKHRTIKEASKAMHEFLGE